MNGQGALSNDPAVLQNVIVKLSLASTLEEAQKLLFNGLDTNNGHNYNPQLITAHFLSLL